MSLRESILASPDAEAREIYVPEWGTKVYVHGLSGIDRERFETRYAAAREAGTTRALLAVLSCRDEDGKRIFEDADAEALATKSVAPLARIFNVAIKLSAISDEDVDALEGN